MRTSNQERILKFAEAKRLLRPRDLAEINGVRTTISRLVAQGQLIKVARGLYAAPSAEIDEKRSLLEISKAAPKAVICLLSALRFHDLTTQNPFKVWIAIEGTTRKPSQSSQLRVVRFSGRAFTDGIEIHTVDGVNLKVYSPAKTIADCFKYRNKIGLDVAIEALRDGWNQNKVTMDDLWHFANICRVRNVMRPYLDSLV